MSEAADIRVKIPLELLNQWKRAARLRNLSLSAFISSLVSNELLRTGELSIAAETPQIADSPQPKKKPNLPPEKHDYDAIAGDWDDD